MALSVRASVVALSAWSHGRPGEEEGEAERCRGGVARWEVGDRNATQLGDCTFLRPWSLVGTETIGLHATGDSREKGSEDGRGRHYSPGEIRERTLE